MESGETKLQRLHIAYNALPPANRVILGFIVTFFRKCLEHRKNQVTPAVLGKSFGPAILRPRGDIGSQEMYNPPLPSSFPFFIIFLSFYLFNVRCNL